MGRCLWRLERFKDMQKVCASKSPDNFRSGKNIAKMAHYRMKRHLTRFAQDESGVMVIFGVYLFVMMLMVVGIGVDVMRFERDRTGLQYTLDRAVLAAADLDQELDADAVVRDYFAKADIEGSLTSVTVDEGIGYRVVTASAQANIATQFMKWSGVDTLTANARSTAQERIEGVEISLILDVSGSMSSNNRMYNMKVAAKNFVSGVLANSNEDNPVSINIIPYATQVSLPQEFSEHVKMSKEHNYSRCVNFEAEDFLTPGLTPGKKYDRTMHFDPWSDYDGRDNDPKRLVPNPVCEDDSRREILVMQDNQAVINAYIDDLWAGGNTSIDIGMKWGTAFLDPTLRGPFSTMIGDGHVPSKFANRPALYKDSETLKVAVLMTDGRNTSQYYVEDDFREGESNIWWNDQEEKYSVYVGLDDDDEDNDGETNEPLFYWPHTDEWKDHAYGEGVFEEEITEYECRSYRRNGSCKRYKRVKTTVTVEEPGSAEILTYADLYARTSLEWIVEDLYEPWMNDSQAWNDWFYNVRKYVSGGTKDYRTQQICDTAKEQGIIVFAVGFEAPSSGRAVLQDCASSASHYFDANGSEIASAFTAIASSIRQLRLTQ